MYIQDSFFTPSGFYQLYCALSVSILKFCFASVSIENLFVLTRFYVGYPYFFRENDKKSNKCRVYAICIVNVWEVIRILAVPSTLTSFSLFIYLWVVFFFLKLYKLCITPSPISTLCWIFCFLLFNPLPIYMKFLLYSILVGHLLKKKWRY